MNIIQLLDQAAGHTPDRPAIIDGPLGRERTTTFAELVDRSRRIATLLDRVGVGPGDGLVMLVPMSATLYAVIAAALRLGAVPVFPDPQQPGPQLALCQGKLRLAVFVGSPKACLWRWFNPALRQVAPVVVSRGWFPGAVSLATARGMKPWHKDVPSGDHLPAMLTFTSGSTGAPKGLLRDHALLGATQELLQRHLDLMPGSIDLATMPALVMANLARGVTSLIPDVDLLHPGRADPARLARTIQHWQVRSMLASPSLVENLADHCIAHDLCLSSLAQVFTGGAPVLPRVFDKLAAMAPQAEAWGLYGSTEAEPIAMLAGRHLSPEDRLDVTQGRGLPAGFPIPEVHLAILEDRWGETLPDCTQAEFAQRRLPPGQPGEIVVSGAHVARHYLNRERDRDTKFRVGDVVWHRTGDAGYLDEQGRLWLTGRCAARLGEGPGAVYPLMVEAALADVPGLARAAFTLHRGWRVLALEWQPGVPRGSLDERLEALSWAGIESVRELRTIPLDRRHNAKIDYPALHKRLDRD